jgi:hypothetical protein
MTGRRETRAQQSVCGYEASVTKNEGVGDCKEKGVSDDHLHHAALYPVLHCSKYRGVKNSKISLVESNVKYFVSVLMN